jgi:hypothetical protein
VDLLLISMFLPIDLTSTVHAVERERRVRALPALPATLVSPGPAWATQWGKAARNSPLTADLHDFESARWLPRAAATTVSSARSPPPGRRRCGVTSTAPGRHQSTRSPESRTLNETRA